MVTLPYEAAAHVAKGDTKPSGKSKQPHLFCHVVYGVQHLSRVWSGLRLSIALTDLQPAVTTRMCWLMLLAQPAAHRHPPHLQHSPELSVSDLESEAGFTDSLYCNGASSHYSNGAATTAAVGGSKTVLATQHDAVIDQMQAKVAAEPVGLTCGLSQRQVQLFCKLVCSVQVRELPAFIAE